MVATIQRIRVSNFKSIREIDLDLETINVFIGANASGKSNIISIFRFLKDIAENGLNNAISMQGGIEYIRNINLGSTKNMVVDFKAKSVITSKMGWALKIKKAGESTHGWGGFCLKELSYSFELKFIKTGYKVLNEKFEAKGEIHELLLTEGDMPFKNGKTLGEGKITLIRDKDCKISQEIDFGKLEVETDELWWSYSRFPTAMTELKFLGKKSAAFSANLTPLSYELGLIFDDLSFFDIDPKSSRKSTFFSGKKVLETDGSNLAIVLKDILENKQKRERFFTITQQILPFVENITVKKFVDKSLIPCLQESYCGKELLPAPWISDGTISIITLIIALFFGDDKVVILEEPERNIHPALISRLMDFIKESSKTSQKQIIITTHNPQVVKYAGIDFLELVQRDKDNFSVVSKPKNNDEVKVFLKNDLGVDELFVRNLLE